MRAGPILWIHRHPMLTDGLVGAVILAVGVIRLTQTPAGAEFRATDWFVYALIGGSAVAACWRRRTPLTVLLVSLVLVSIRQLMNYVDTPDTVIPILAAYAFGRYTKDRDRFPWIAGAVLASLSIGSIVAVAIGSPRAHSEFLGGNKLLFGTATLLGNAILFGTAFLLGDNMYRRAQRLVSLQDRNDQLERERDLLSRNAVAAERARLARELHDVVAHSVSVMAVQAGGARRVIATKPHLAAEALGVIEQTARQTLDELRHLLGVLRTDTGEVANAPQPGVNDLHALASTVPAHSVTVSVDGNLPTLSSIVDLSAYRIVQEALTNVRKHAGPADVEVVLRAKSGSLIVVVLDNGRGAAADQTGGGHGLTGMRERAALCGGTLEAGPREGGGWRVLATLPLEVAS